MKTENKKYLLLLLFVTFVIFSLFPATSVDAAGTRTWAKYTANSHAHQDSWQESYTYTERSCTKQETTSYINGDNEHVHVSTCVGWVTETKTGYRTVYGSTYYTYSRGSYMSDVSATEGTYPSDGYYGGYYYVLYPNQSPNVAVNNTSYSVNGSGQFQMSGTLSDADNDAVTVSVSIGGVTKSTTIANAASTKNWSLSWNASEVGQANYTGIRVNVSDGKGGANSATYTGTIIVDKTNPTISRIDATTYLNNPARTTFTATVYGVADTGGSGYDYVYWTSKKDGESQYTNHGVGLNSGTNNSYAIPSRGEGTYTVTATAYDKVKNASVTLTTTFVLDGTGPTSTSQIVTRPGSSVAVKEVPYTDGSFDLYAYGVTDNLSGVKKVRFAVWTSDNGQDDLIWYDGTNMGNGTWKLNVLLSAHNNERGQYIIHPYYYDNVDNWKANGIEVRVTSPPTITVSSIDKTIAGKSDTISVKGTVSDPDGDLVTLTATLGKSTQKATVANGVGEYEFVFPAKEVGEGTYSNIRVNATDGTFSPYKDFTFAALKVDLTDPFFWSASKSPNEPTSGNIEVQVNVSDVFTGVKQITLPDNTVIKGKLNAVYEVTENGSYVFKVEDNAGNVTSHTVKVDNIDRTAPNVTLVNLVQLQNGTFKVTVKANDSAGILSANLEDNTELTYDEKLKQYVSRTLISKPSSVTVTDKAGNVTEAIQFAALPTVKYPSGYSADKKMKEDVVLNLSGTHTLSYKLGIRGYQCSSNPCDLTLTKSETVAATNTNGVISSTLTFDVTNIDKKPYNLVITAQKMESNENKVAFTWNLDITNPIITCSDGKSTVQYTPTGTSFVVDVANKTYTCTLTGEFEGNKVTSNTATIYPNYDKEIIVSTPETSFPTQVIDKNIFKENTQMGTTYFINLNRNNESGKTISIPGVLKR